MVDRIRRLLPPRDIAGVAASQGFRLLILVWVGRYVSQQLGADGILAMGVLQNLLVLGISLPAMALQMPIQQAVASAGPDGEARGAEGFLLGQALALVSAAAVVVLVASGKIWLPGGLPGVLWILPIGICCTAAASDLQAWTIGRKLLGRTNILAAVLSPLQALWLLGWLMLGRAGLVPGVLLFGVVALPTTIFWLGIPRLRPLAKRLANLRSWWPLLAMASLTTVLGPSAQMVLRQHALGDGIQSGANWQAAIRLSDILFGTWSMAFSVWALPRLAARSKGSNRQALSMGGAAAMASVVLLAAPLLLSVAYAHRFQGATGVLRLQVVAEVSRAFGLPWTLRLMAHRAVRTFSLLELGATVFQMGLAWLLIPRIGILGAPLAVLLESAATGLLTRHLVLRLDASSPPLADHPS